MLQGSKTGRTSVVLWLALFVSASGTAHGYRKLLETGCTTAWSQCGGRTCVNGSTTCSDSAYLCCPSSYSCQRQSQWYWQCLAASSASGLLTANAPAPATAAAVSPTLHKSPPPPSSLASDTLAPAFSEANVPPVLEYGLAYPPQGSALSDDVTQALPCAQAYTFASYLDHSGIDAPDGAYKETCSDISYDCYTDIITATCYNNEEGGYHQPSQLTHASSCAGSIATLDGSLKCLPKSSPQPSSFAAAPAACVPFEFYSALDSSGINAPDGSYKETCGEIYYNCSTDTLTANCEGTQTSLTHASRCHDSITGKPGSIANIDGELKCQSGVEN